MCFCSMCILEQRELIFRDTTFDGHTPCVYVNFTNPVFLSRISLFLYSYKLQNEQLFYYIKLALICNIMY